MILMNKQGINKILKINILNKTSEINIKLCV